MLYLINKETYEVHRTDCKHLPELKNRKMLNSSNLKDAVNEAKKEYPKANTCEYCKEKEKGN